LDLTVSKYSKSIYEIICCLFYAQVTLYFRINYRFLVTFNEKGGIRDDLDIHSLKPVCLYLYVHRKRSDKMKSNEVRDFRWKKFSVATLLCIRLK